MYRFLKQSQQVLKGKSQLLMKMLGLGLMTSGLNYMLNGQNKIIWLDDSDLFGKFIPRSQLSKQINWEVFSEEGLKQAKEQKFDIVIFIDPGRFKPEFEEQVSEFLARIQEFQKQTKGRPIKFLKKEFKNDKEIDEFQKKYQVKIEDDSLLLLQNRYYGEHNAGFYVVGPYEYFDKQDQIMKFFRKLNKISEANLQKFYNTTSQQVNQDHLLLLVYLDKNDPKSKKLEQKMGLLSLAPDFSNDANLHFFKITDKKIAQSLGIEESGQIYMMLKKSKLIVKCNQEKQISGKNFVVEKGADLSSGILNIIESLSNKYNEISLFSRKGFDESQKVFTVFLEIDSNRANKQTINQFYKVLSELKQSNHESLKDVGFVNILRNRKGQNPIGLLFRDENKIIKRSIAAQSTNKKEIEDLYSNEKQEDRSAPRSFIYEFPQEQIPLNKDSLIQFIEQVKNGDKEHEYFKSQKEQNYRIYSQKVVGKNFKRIVLDNNLNQAVFFFSNHCGACKYYGPLYEEEARKSLIEDNGIRYNRMNSDENQLNCAQNFAYTPVFMIFKAGNKQAPYVYRSNKFTVELLRDFLNITSQFKVIDYSNLKNHVDQVSSLNIQFEKV